MAPTGSLDPTKIVVGTAATAGGLYIAPEGTDLPTDATTALDTAYQVVGYVAEDGQPTLAQALESEDITAWQSLSPLRTILTGKMLSLSFTLMETNPVAMGLYFGAASPPVVDGAYSIDISADKLPPNYVAVVDVVDGLQALRFVLNKATLSENGDTEFSRSAATGFPVTLKGLNDGSGIIGTLHNDNGSGPDPLTAAVKASVK